jgi:predicted nucleotidyltransferase component of viral defense system
MIARPILEKWRAKAPWALLGQVEQDLIISRALVEIFNNDYLKSRIAFRGGTALNKLIFPRPLRYSEDIDLNRLETGASGAVIDEVRNALEQMLGRPKKVKSTERSIKIIYDYDSIEGGLAKLKIEINTRETLPEHKLQSIPYTVDTDYFFGETKIMSFDTEEMIGSKLRALYQRSKGRDLFDLYELGKMNFNWEKIITSFHKLKIGASRLDFENNINEKMKDNEFLEDMDLLLPDGVQYDVQDAYEWFKRKVLPKI